MMSSEEVKRNAIAHLEAAKELIMQAYVQARLAAFDVKRAGDCEVAENIIAASTDIKEKAQVLNDFIDFAEM